MTPRSVLQVIAGAGAGKTTYLTEAIDSQMAKDPLSITLAATFTRQAAQELRTRLKIKQKGAKAHAPAKTLWAGTLHALALQLYRESGATISKGETYKLVKNDELLDRGIQALHQSSLPPWITRIGFLAVDEAQDLDAKQIEFLGLLLQRNPSATVLLVGDPHQSIYQFRGASAHYLTKPETWIPGPVTVTSVTLDKNYRSAQPIVHLAASVVGRPLVPARQEQHTAIRALTNPTAAEEAHAIVGEIRTLLAVGVPPAHVAVLARTRKQLEAIQQEASTWRVPVWTVPTHEDLEADPDSPGSSSNLTVPSHPPTPAVTLSTIHAAKGREWSVVFLAGCQEGLLPHRSGDPEEEQNLLYVGISRAKQLLWISSWGPPSSLLPHEARPMARSLPTLKTPTNPMGTGTHSRPFLSDFRTSESPATSVSQHDVWPALAAGLAGLLLGLAI